MVIAGVGAGRVEPGLASEAKNVLQRYHGKICWGTLRHANQSPIRSIVALTNQSNYCAAFLVAQSGPPTHCGVVVVGAGVDHVIGSQAMRQVCVGSGIAESEL